MPRGPPKGQGPPAGAMRAAAARPNLSGKADSEGMDHCTTVAATDALAKKGPLP
jgi:hypothetical protein